jgi:hypothetical protein
MHWADGLILIGVDRGRRAILSHSGRCFSSTGRSPFCLDTLPRIVLLDHVPVARGLMMGCQPEQGLERNVSVKAAIVAKDEFIEIRVDVRAP